MQDLHHDHVVLERVQARRFELAASDADQVGDGIGFGRREIAGLAHFLGLLFGETNAEVIAAGGNRVAFFAVDFEILAAERPVPRGLDYALRLGVLHQDGGFIVHFRIDRGLVGLGDGGDGEGALIVHQPGHEVGAVAAEIEERAGAVLHGVGEPREKFGLNVDLLRTLMAVHGDHPADVAGGLLFLDELPDFAVAFVPGGLIVDHDGNAAGAGGTLDAAGLGDAGGQRLFHHDGDVAGRAGFDHRDMVGGGGEGGDGFGLGLIQHRGEVLKDDLGREVIALGVAGAKGRVGVEDAHDFDIFARLRRA